MRVLCCAGYTGQGDPESPTDPPRPAKRRLMPLFRPVAGSGEFREDGGARSSDRRHARRDRRSGAQALAGANAGDYDGDDHSAGVCSVRDRGDPLDIDMLARDGDDNDGGGSGSGRHGGSTACGPHLSRKARKNALKNQRRSADKRA
jgi:hypothetical protein